MTDASVVVVGGGATGLGVARDLALRGVDVTLLERGPLAGGTTGHNHGLLHSGARYADDDPETARECAAENAVLRRIAPHAVTDVGGLFLALDGDDGAYVDRKLAACRACGIDADPVAPATAREREPGLSAAVDRAFRVPDATVDPLALAVSTALDAERAGATVSVGVEVTDVTVRDGRVTGVELRRVEEYGAGAGGVDGGDGDDGTAGSGADGAATGNGGGASVRGDGGAGREVPAEAGESTHLAADHVVNAAGPWAGRVAAMAGVDVPLAPSRGAMPVVDAGLGTVLNRCRPRTQGDVAVPGPGGRAILGTTDVPVADPEDYPREEWEVELVREEVAEMFPAAADAPVRRTYWGVRPVYDPGAGAGTNAGPGADAGAGADAGPGDGAGDARRAGVDGGRSAGGGRDPTAASRGFAVLEGAHGGRPGLTTVVGGKLTTHRLMAEAVTDRVCATLGVEGACRTADRPLPGADDPGLLAAARRRFGLDGATLGAVGDGTGD